MVLNSSVSSLEVKEIPSPEAGGHFSCAILLNVVPFNATTFPIAVEPREAFGSPQSITEVSKERVVLRKRVLSIDSSMGENY
jgi:hypothetical protein